MVETRRTESLGRIYSRDDVERLTMIKQLVDLGNPISSVANLSDSQFGSDSNRTIVPANRYSSCHAPGTQRFSGLPRRHPDAAGERLGGLSSSAPSATTVILSAPYLLAPDVLILNMRASTRKRFRR